MLQMLAPKLPLNINRTYLYTWKQHWNSVLLHGKEKIESHYVHFHYAIVGMWGPSQTQGDEGSPSLSSGIVAAHISCKLRNMSTTLLGRERSTRDHFASRFSLRKIHRPTKAIIWSQLTLISDRSCPPVDWEFSLLDRLLGKATDGIHSKAESH